MRFFICDVGFIRAQKVNKKSNNTRGPHVPSKTAIYILRTEEAKFSLLQHKNRAADLEGTHHQPLSRHPAAKVKWWRKASTSRQTRARGAKKKKKQKQNSKKHNSFGVFF